jgi:hypothetical protein
MNFLVPLQMSPFDVEVKRVGSLSEKGLGTQDCLPVADRQTGLSAVDVLASGMGDERPHY